MVLMLMFSSHCLSALVTFWGYGPFLRNEVYGKVPCSACDTWIWSHAVQEYFMKLVDDTVEVSVKHVRAFVHQYLSVRLDEARSQIEQYGGRYTEAMLHAMETSKQGAAPARNFTCR